MTDTPKPRTPPDQAGWPAPTGSDPEVQNPVEATKDALFDAKLEVRKKRVDAEVARTAALNAARYEAVKGFAEAYREIAKGSIQRARDGADVVLKASAAIVTLYSGLLALVFAADGNPLPARGIAAPIFLGASVVFATAYVAFLRAESGEVRQPDERALESHVVAWGEALAAITARIAERRVWTLRAAVLCLGVGLAYLPLAFVDIGSPSQTSSSEDSNATENWPKVDSAAGDDPAQQRTLYRQQVKQYVASLDSGSDDESASSADGEGWLLLWLVLFGAGVVAIGTNPETLRRLSGGAVDTVKHRGHGGEQPSKELESSTGQGRG